jgi:hypothetical protein
MAFALIAGGAALFAQGTFKIPFKTDQVLAEFWLPGQKGFLIHSLKGAHQSQVVKGEMTRK